MNKIKIIIKESKRLAETKFNFPTKGLAMLLQEKPGRANIILYYYDPVNKTYEVAGSVDFRLTDEPCIPTTYEVGTIYTDKKYRGIGMGAFLYGLAFYYTSSNDIGLTSDHTVGTEDAAKKKWKQFEKNPRFEKQVTAQGNTKFDYDNSTPDPDDDCDDGFEGKTGLATHYSFKDKNHKQFENTFLKLQKAHETYLSRSRNPAETIKDLESQASQGFNAAYGT